MAVSDGHGSRRCPRSDVGARMAVNAALMVLEQFAHEHAVGDLPDPDAWDALPQRISTRWLLAVDRHLAWSPLDDDSTVPYGCTLLAMVATDRWAGWLQIGDGDILAVTAGGLVTRPVPGDPRLLGNATTSMSGHQPWRDFRVHARSGPPPALSVLTTDGYCNSFASDAGFMRVGSDLLSMIESTDLPSVLCQLPAWLTETSVLGSGDDITVGLALNR